MLVNRRTIHLAILFCVCFAVLGGRLFLIGVGKGKPDSSAGPLWRQSLGSRAALEHVSTVMVDDGRGRILFRNGAPWQPVARPGMVQLGHHPALRVLVRDATRVPAHPVVGVVGRPDVWPQATRSVAEQGRAGLESTFDDLLSGKRPGLLAVDVNRDGEDLDHGLGMVPPIRGADIRTTVDAVWQRAAESTLRRQKLQRGAVVILDVATGDVLAMASQDPWNGRSRPASAIRAESPGSIFKLVTSAAALESLKTGPDGRFFCPGFLDTPQVHMRCWTRHGEEDLLQALAQSCDVAFAQVGIRLGRNGFSEIWRRLHLEGTNLQTVHGLPVLPGTEAGVLFRTSGGDPGLLANTAIGQQDTRLTPLAAANLARTIANGGGYRPARLVLDAERDGRAGRHFPDSPEERAMSAFTARTLQSGMRMAVVSTQGTAHGLALQRVACAVKTGTAELPTDGRVNAWMVGFAPYDRPRIAFCVVAENTTSPIGHQAVKNMAASVLDADAAFHPEDAGTRLPVSVQQTSEKS